MQAIKWQNQIDWEARKDGFETKITFCFSTEGTDDRSICEHTILLGIRPNGDGKWKFGGRALVRPDGSSRWPIGISGEVAGDKLAAAIAAIHASIMEARKLAAEFALRAKSASLNPFDRSGVKVELESLRNSAINHSDLSVSFALISELVKAE